jgi:hypothetical protein
VPGVFVYATSQTNQSEEYNVGESDEEAHTHSVPHPCSARLGLQQQRLPTSEAYGM